MKFAVGIGMLFVGILIGAFLQHYHPLLPLPLNQKSQYPPLSDSSAVISYSSSNEEGILMGNILSFDKENGLLYLTVFGSPAGNFTSKVSIEYSDVTPLFLAVEGDIGSTEQAVSFSLLEAGKRVLVFYDTSAWQNGQIIAARKIVVLPVISKK